MVEATSPTFRSTTPAPSNVGNDGTFGGARTATEDAADKLKKSASGAMTDLKDLASAAKDDAKSYAGAAASDAATAFKDAVESNKTAGADAIATLARSAKDAADNIEQQAPQVASLVRGAADGVERISTDIRDRSVGELATSVSDFAKRQPAAFFGFGILAGVVLARLMRASDR